MGLKALLDSKAILQQEVTNRRAELELALAPILAQVEATDKEIYDLLAPDLVAIRKLQQKEFGAVHVTKDGYRVVETIQKKIRWDQEQLFGVFHKIQSTGDNPFDWMKAEFKVGEKEFGAYPKNIQAVFAPAREVSKGDPKLEFKLMEAPDA